MQITSFGTLMTIHFHATFNIIQSFFQGFYFIKPCLLLRELKAEQGKWERGKLGYNGTNALVCSLWQYGLLSFQMGDTKLERFLPRNQHTERKLINFQFWVKRLQNLTFKVNCLFQKSSDSFSIFFSLKNTNLGAHFLLLTLFDNINFSTTLLLKLGQIFDEVAKLGKSTQDAHNPGKWLIL